MTISSRRTSLFLAAAGSLLLGLVPALSQLDNAFMPKGGKTLLLEVLGDSPDREELLQILGARRSETEWRAAMEKRTKQLTDRELRTLAAYLAVNMPVQAPQQIADRAAKRNELDAALPRDGRELAWNECQFCHSLFTSHLTQERDVQAWLNMFQSPFHRELKLTKQEREEFARYSAINMPMKIEDVPEDLRF
jgi:hypothetical protein